jgi:phosphatidylglycerol---prolipoprotein diacylglyceryl transferase
MDPIMIQLGPLALRWYGFLIALGVLLGSQWALHEAKKRDLDTEKLLDMTLWLVIAGLVGARLVYVLTSPAAYFGPGGNPLSAFAIWQGGGSIHGGILGIVIAVWIYSRVHNLNMWAYLDVLTPVGALGVIGGRIGNFMNGTDTTGRVTGWPIGFTWPEPGTPTFGALGRFIFGDNLWAAAPQVLVNGELARGPVHLTQLYGVLIGVALVFILLWAFRRSRTPGFVWWQFVLWYSVLRSVFEETFRDNPLPWNLYLSEGIDAPGIGIFTLTQLVSIPLVLVALYMILTLEPDQPERREYLNRKARGR